MVDGNNQRSAPRRSSRLCNQRRSKENVPPPDANAVSSKDSKGRSLEAEGEVAFVAVRSEIPEEEPVALEDRSAKEAASKATDAKTAPPDEDEEDVVFIGIGSEMKEEKIVTPRGSNTETDLDGEVEVLCVGIRNEIKLPHMRCHCTVHAFAPNMDTNQEYCDDCWCYICDTPVKECQYWSDHCHATDQADRWCKMREVVQQKGVTFEFANLEIFTGILATFWKFKMENMVLLFRGSRYLWGGSSVRDEAGKTISVRFALMKGMFRTYINKVTQSVKCPVNILYKDLVEKRKPRNERVLFSLGSDMGLYMNCSGQARLPRGEEGMYSSTIATTRFDAEKAGYFLGGIKHPILATVAVAASHLQRAVAQLLSSVSSQVSFTFRSQDNSIVLETFDQKCKVPAHSTTNRSRTANSVSWKCPYTLDLAALVDLAYGPSCLTDSITFNMGESAWSAVLTFPNNEGNISIVRKWES